MTAGGLILKQLELGPMMNFVYIVGCEQTRQAAAVDPAWDVKAILAAARKLDLHLHHVLLTHAHPDHINGLEELLDTTDAMVYVNA